MLKTGIAFLPWLVVLAVVIEAGDREPGTVATCLTGLGIEPSGKGEVAGYDGAIALQIVLRCATSVHPEAQARIADELNSTDSFINGGILPFGAIQFVLVGEHALDLSSSSMVLLYISMSLYVKRKRCANNE